MSSSWRTSSALPSSPPRAFAYTPAETHLAEKLHVYTMPRGRPNSRVKDLPDLALLGSIRPIEGPKVRAAIERTFAFRTTLPAPAVLPVPSRTWAEPNARIADESELVWKTLDEDFVAARLCHSPQVARMQAQAARRAGILGGEQDSGSSWESTITMCTAA